MTHKEKVQDEFQRVMPRLSRGEIQNPKNVIEDLSKEHTEKEEFYEVVLEGKGIHCFDTKQEREHSFWHIENIAIFCRSLSGAGLA